MAWHSSASLTGQQFRQAGPRRTRPVAAPANPNSAGRPLLADLLTRPARPRPPTWSKLSQAFRVAGPVGDGRTAPHAAQFRLPCFVSDGDVTMPGLPTGRHTSPAALTLFASACWGGARLAGPACRPRPASAVLRGPCNDCQPPTFWAGPTCPMYTLVVVGADVIKVEVDAPARRVPISRAVPWGCDLGTRSVWCVRWHEPLQA